MSSLFSKCSGLEESCLRLEEWIVVCGSMRDIWLRYLLCYYWCRQCVRLLYVLFDCELFVGAQWGICGHLEQN